MRDFHPGLLSIIELHFETIEAYLAEDFVLIASEEVRLPPAGPPCRRSDRRKRAGEIQVISLAVRAGGEPARRGRLH
jgi:hypothetical protein